MAEPIVPRHVELLGLSADDFAQAAALFVSLAPAVVRDLRQAHQAGDLGHTRLLAHRLVGSLGFFQPESAVFAARVEQMIDRQIIAALEPALEALLDELMRVAAALQGVGAAPVS